MSKLNTGSGAVDEVDRSISSTCHGLNGVTDNILYCRPQVTKKPKMAKFRVSDKVTARERSLL